MGTYDFLMLSQDEQNDILTNESQFVLRKEGQGSYCDLYAVALFFIEVEKEFFTEKVLNISIFVTGNKLDKYSGDVLLQY